MTDSRATTTAADDRTAWADERAGAPAPTAPPAPRPLPLVTRKGAWLSLFAGLAVIVALFGLVGGAKNGTPQGTVPASADSARVAQLQKSFPGADQSTVIAVVTRAGGEALTPADLGATKQLAARLTQHTGHDARGPIPSEDGKAALVLVTVDATADNSAMAKRIGDLRAAAREAAPAGTQVQVTGGAAFGADIAGAFADANIRLLLTTIGIVALLLLLTYRSPLLMLVPLVVIGLADGLAGRVTAALGNAFGWQFDAGIVSVLVFGAGTNYALLLISRYREELRRTEDHRAALSTAWRGSLGAIVASNVTVVLALATLGLAALPSTHGLGLASAVGLVIALLAVLVVLPPALALLGRRVFWPVVPRVSTAVEDPDRTVYCRVARAETARPAVTLAASLALLAVVATGLLGTRVGLTQAERFRVASESAAGLATLSDHFPAGESQPHTVLVDPAHAEAYRAAAAAVPGVVRVTPTGATPEWTRLSVVGSAAPDTAEAFTTVERLRAATPAGATVLVGGPTAQEYDSRAAADADLRLIAPIVLGLVFVVLGLLLRSVVAPLLLGSLNVLSAVAALGAGTWVGETFFGFPGLDSQVPLLAFLFLVALGIDYSIFLAHRIKAEARTHGTTEGTVRAVAATGGVITSAGIVLAAVFAALGVLPLVVLGQLGLIVGLGVLLDTLLVRTVVVPAVVALAGDRFWWPGRA